MTIWELLFLVWIGFGFAWIGFWSVYWTRKWWQHRHPLVTFTVGSSNYTRHLKLGTRISFYDGGKTTYGIIKKINGKDITIRRD